MVVLYRIVISDASVSRKFHPCVEGIAVLDIGHGVAWAAEAYEEIGPQRIMRNVWFLSPSHYLSSPSYLSLLHIRIVVAQIPGHIAGSSPSVSTTVRALHHYRKKI